MADFGELYELAIEEEQALQGFREDFTGKVSGYIATQMEKDVNGMPFYLGDPITDSDLEDTAETAFEALRFSEARVGQLAYSTQMLRQGKEFKHYEAEGESYRGSELAQMLKNCLDGFEEFEDAVESNLEVVIYDEDSPVENSELAGQRNIPDFDIEDWRWPRENLWPAEVEL